MDANTLNQLTRLSRANMTSRQAATLAIADRDGQVTGASLGVELGMSHAAVTEMLARMVEKRLLREDGRSDADRRRVPYMLAPTGRKVLMKLSNNQK